MREDRVLFIKNVIMDHAADTKLGLFSIIFAANGQAACRVHLRFLNHLCRLFEGPFFADHLWFCGSD